MNRNQLEALRALQEAAEAQAEALRDLYYASVQANPEVAGLILAPRQLPFRAECSE